MALESSLQARCVAAVEARGCIFVRGNPVEGWPDGQVIWTPRRHFWVEFKKASDSPFTRAQKVRIPWLKKRGESVYRIESEEQMLEALAVERIKG